MVRRLIKLLNIIYRLLIPNNKQLVINASLFQYGPYIKHFNLGDDLNVYLMELLTRKKVVTYYNCFRKKRENYLCIGSTLEFLSDEHSIVWGSGAICGTTPLKIHPKKVLAVRGPLTRDYLLSQGIKCPEIYGDPALLLPLVYSPKVHKKYRIGIIPHFVDINNQYLKEFIANNNNVKLIKIQSYRNWKTFINEVNECEFVMSSSLHGLIISDAYSIPNIWIKFSDDVIGDGFKFRDYYASVNKNITDPIIIDSAKSIEKVYEFKSNWQPITFDYNKLIVSCPFNIKLKNENFIH